MTMEPWEAERLVLTEIVLDEITATYVRVLGVQSRQIAAVSEGIHALLLEEIGAAAHAELTKATLRKLEQAFPSKPFSGRERHHDHRRTDGDDDECCN